MNSAGFVLQGVRYFDHIIRNQQWTKLVSLHESRGTVNAMLVNNSMETYKGLN